MPLQHGQAGGYHVLLIFGEFHQRRRAYGPLLAQAVAVEFVKRLKINQVWFRRGQGPTVFDLFNHPVAHRFAFVPQPLEPFPDFADVSAVGHGVVQLGVAGEAGGGEVR